MRAKLKYSGDLEELQKYIEYCRLIPNNRRLINQTTKYTIKEIKNPVRKPKAVMPGSEIPLVVM